MDFDNLLSEILDELINGKDVDIEDYCKKYPEHRSAILSKFKIAEFLRNSFHEDDLSGKQLGEYTILQELGRGGMGIVFLGIQPALSRLSAIKILSPSFSRDQEAINNFQAEAKTIAKFSHPNIVPIYSVSDDKGVRYIAMGYVSGRSLKDIIEAFRDKKCPDHLKTMAIKSILQESLIGNSDLSQKNITLKRDVKFWEKSYFHFSALIGSEIAEALSYAHQNGIIHGDLKPSNILLTKEAIPMVADFGLSRDMKELSLSKNNEFSGTLSFAAPEQIRENIINEKTDIWSLGVTLYELLTLQKPFADKTVRETADKILRGNSLPLKTHNKNIPIELEAITLKCLEIDPKNRYETLADLSGDLRNYLESKPIKAKPIGFVARTCKWIKRQPVLASLITGFFISVLIASFFSYFLGIEALLDRGTKLHSSGSFAQAEKTYNEALALSSRAPFTRSVRAKIFHCLGDLFSRSGSTKESLQKAMDYYNQSLEINPNNNGALNSAASLCEELGNYTEAFKYHERMLNNTKSSQRALPVYHYANLLIKLNLTNEALMFLGREYSNVRGDPLVIGSICSALEKLVESLKYTLLPIKNYSDIEQVLKNHGFSAEDIKSIIEKFRVLSPWFDNSNNPT